MSIEELYEGEGLEAGVMASVIVAVLEVETTAEEVDLGGGNGGGGPGDGEGTKWNRCPTVFYMVQSFKLTERCNLSLYLRFRQPEALKSLIWGSALKNFAAKTNSV